MSYLHLPRLVFTGDFLSDVSTVNNDTAHYNNTTFIPSFQEPGQGATNGWWNPEGGASFGFQRCQVQQVTLKDGTVLTDPVLDGVLGQIVGGPSGRSAGKMVDLDPDAQMVSALWCVQLRIYTSANELLLQGELTTTCFRDLQLRQMDGGKANGQPLGAAWTTVLTDIVWGEKAATSPFLMQLKSVTQCNKISVNLNGFGYYYAHNDGRFSLGRMLGAIGPWFEGEPDTFANGRRLYGVLNAGSASRPATYFNISNFLVDSPKKSLSIDLGGSFPIADSMGTIKFSQSLVVAVSKKPLTFVPDAQQAVCYVDAADFLPIGPVPYQSGTDWLNHTGGIVSFSGLSDDILTALASNQMLLLTPSSTPGIQQWAVVAREAIEGLFVRADNFVQRLDCGDTQTVNVYASQWGKPLANQAIDILLAPPTPNTPVGPNNPISELYGNNFPPEGLTFPTIVTTNAKGVAQWSVTGNAINSPRVYLDGQIYSLSCELPGKTDDFAAIAMAPDGIQIHLRDYFVVPDHPTWNDIAEIMIQYSNLYPIMSKYIVNLADPEAVKAKKDILIFAFSQDMENTMHMPVTRDLSKTKRQTILKWLAAPEMVVKSSKALVKEKVKTENPVPNGTTLTEAQTKYIEAVKAKNGAMPPFPVLDTLFETI